MCISSSFCTLTSVVNVYDVDLARGLSRIVLYETPVVSLHCEKFGRNVLCGLR